MICDACNSAIHCSCFGMANFDDDGEDEDEWLCERCEHVYNDLYLNGKSKPYRNIEFEYKCALCKEQGGIMKEVKIVE